MKGMMKTKQEVTDRIEEFLVGWNRLEWMATHGTWASNAWDTPRVEYDRELQELTDIVRDIPDGVDCDPNKLQTLLREARESLIRLEDASLALDGQVRPDSSDYIETGVLDPHGVAHEPARAVAERKWDAWQAIEGWQALRVRDDLFVNWFRIPNTDLRHARDLYVLVERGFFADADD